MHLTFPGQNEQVKLNESHSLIAHLCTILQEVVWVILYNEDVILARQAVYFPQSVFAHSDACRIVCMWHDVQQLKHNIKTTLALHL